MRVKVDIISGFLGAGKTELIKKLIKDCFYKEKIVIIENEFGEVNIDKEILGGNNLEIKEINDGCICCSLLGNFKEAIVEIVDGLDVDRIIIEPSGIGQLSDILKSLQGLNIEEKIEKNMVITVVDSENFKEYIENFGEFYKNQISNCKTIILTRCENLKDEQINYLKKELIKINLNAQVICSSKRTTGNEILSQYYSRDYNNLIRIKKPRNLVKIIKVNQKANRQLFESISIITKRNFKKSELETILKEINNGEYGKIIRVKGIVCKKGDKENYYKFDYVLNRFYIELNNFSNNGVICIIGKNLKKEKLNSMFI